MLELWFTTKEEAERTEDELSKFGEPERLKKVKPHAYQHAVLSKPYQETIEYLDERIGEEENEENPLQD